MSEEEVKTRILHGITQWFHVWHLDNTITFTPYNDINLIKIMGGGNRQSNQEVMENLRRMQNPA